MKTNFTKNSLYFIAVFLLFGFVPSNKNKSITYTLNFKHYVGNNILLLDTVNYQNQLQQSFLVSKFKYYVSNISLIKTDGSKYVSKQFYLIDEDNENSKTITLNNVPYGPYANVLFTLGVDSLHNCSGLQQGDLDPVKGMFWAWNTGYVFLKLEGKSPKSTSPLNILEYHIGGYKNPSNCIKNIMLNIDKNTNVVNIKTDIQEIFKTPTTIDFNEISSVVGVNNASTIANNYTDMFSIINIK